ncbi:competence protein CoiA [Saccharococcus sp. Marseille-Q5394]|uniref:competence protein CoiA n=1 Tax=Saccharococcus sp. Marseille-Q5394 TaxID=2972778 RepID=UPI0021C6F9DC|nr:competence protein CoiA [Saccharococcus sp. Marseille-Q5394]
MKEAWHKNDSKIYIIPQSLSESEVMNHKQIARKGTFICPYCKAKLIVKSGEVLGNFFSHQHGEGCEPSKLSEARYRKYEKQKKNDTPRHLQILALMNDELEVLSRVYPHLSISYGYLNSDFKKYIPDLALKINANKYAITILTNISNSTDSSIAKSIQQERIYYKSLGFDALFFIERNNLGVDTNGRSLVLWAAEREALSTQKADLHWVEFLSKLAPMNEQQKVLKLPNTELIVKSILYITPANEEIAIESFRVLEQKNATPARAYFLSEPYKLTFSKAFKLDNDSLTLSDLQIESEQQKQYAATFQRAKALYAEEQEKLMRSNQEREGVIRIKPESKIWKGYKENNKSNQVDFKNNSYKKATKNERMEMLRRTYNSNN